MKNSMIHKGKDKNYFLNSQAHDKKKKKGKLLFFRATSLSFHQLGYLDSNQE